MASWELVVVPASETESPALDVGIQAVPGNGGVPESSASEEGWEGGFSLSSPCAAKKYGRWVRQEDGKFRWVVFELEQCHNDCTVLQ